MSVTNPRWEEISGPGGDIHVRPDIRPMLEEYGLKTFSDWMSLRDLSCREISMRPGRPVVALRVPGLSQDLFLKRHFEAPRAENLFQKLGLLATHSEGRKEALRYSGFKDSGVSVPEVVCWGEGKW